MQAAARRPRSSRSSARGVRRPGAASAGAPSRTTVCSVAPARGRRRQQGRRRRRAGSTSATTTASPSERRHEQRRGVRRRTCTPILRPVSRPSASVGGRALGDAGAGLAHGRGQHDARRRRCPGSSRSCCSVAAGGGEGQRAAAERLPDRQVRGAARRPRAAARRPRAGPSPSPPYASGTASAEQPGLGAARPSRPRGRAPRDHVAHGLAGPRPSRDSRRASSTAVDGRQRQTVTCSSLAERGRHVLPVHRASWPASAVYVPWAPIPEGRMVELPGPRRRRTSPTRPGPHPDSPTVAAAARGRLHRAAHLVPGDPAAGSSGTGWSPSTSAGTAAASSPRSSRSTTAPTTPPRCSTCSGIDAGDRRRLLDGLDRRPAGLAPAPRPGRRAGAVRHHRPVPASTVASGCSTRAWSSRWSAPAASPGRVRRCARRARPPRRSTSTPTDIHDWALRRVPQHQPVGGRPGGGRARPAPLAPVAVADRRPDRGGGHQRRTGDPAGPAARRWPAGSPAPPSTTSTPATPAACWRRRCSCRPSSRRSPPSTPAAATSRGERAPSPCRPGLADVLATSVAGLIATSSWLPSARLLPDRRRLLLRLDGRLQLRRAPRGSAAPGRRRPASTRGRR